MRLAAAVPFFEVHDRELDGIDQAIAETLAHEIKRSVAELPRRGPAESKEFSAETPAAARFAAAAWLQDFSTHGPLDIASIQTSGEHGKFTAIVTFRSSEWRPEGGIDESRIAIDISSQPPHKAPLASADLPRMSAVEWPVCKMPPVTPLHLGGAEEDDPLVA